MNDLKSFRLAATIIFAGVLLSLLAGFFHPDHAYANDHVTTFTEYAHSAVWKAVHLGQFAGMLVLIAGLLLLSQVLNAKVGIAGFLNKFGAISACIALGLYGVLQAVDGVALKQAVDAWVNAPVAEKTIRFASAESVRWLEWAVRSYQSYVLGLTLLLLGIVIVLAMGLPKTIGVLMGLSGIAYITQGWVIGSQGFSNANTFPTLAGIGLTLIWSVWLVVIAWRTKGSITATEQREFAHT